MALRTPLEKARQAANASRGTQFDSGDDPQRRNMAPKAVPLGGSTPKPRPPARTD